MPRNQEVIRQWKLLHALESSRHGASIDALSKQLEVTTRTIRRDLAALQEAGFALYDERDEDGHVSWRLDGQVLKGIDTGFTLAELCALYLSRNILEAVAGTPFQRDLTNAFERLGKMLSPRMRQFLDRLPTVLVAKAGPRASGGASSPDIVARLLEATLHFRVTTMRYHSVSSGRSQGLSRPSLPPGIRAGRALPAGVRPEYKAVRTFAVDRIASVSLEKQTFTVTQPVGDDVFANSLGVNTGPAERVEIEFDAARRSLRPGAGLAPLAATRGRSGRRRVGDAERVPRLGAAQLDSQLGPVRSSGFAGTAGKRDPRRSGGSWHPIPRHPRPRKQRLQHTYDITPSLLLLAGWLLLFLAGPLAPSLLYRLALVRRGRISSTSF